MNLACAGPLVCMWLGRNGATQGDEIVATRDRVGRKLAWWSVIGFVVGMILGTVQLSLGASPGWMQALHRLPARGLWFAGAELAFSLVCLLAYAGCWHQLRSHRWWHALLAMLSSSNLLYHFPPLMTVLAKLMNNPNWAKAEVLDRAALLPLMMRAEVVALSVHFALASIAVAGIVVLWQLSRDIDEGDEGVASSLGRKSAWLTLVVTGLQVPVGVWLLVSLPTKSQAALMGGSALASLAFIGALLLTFLLLQKLLAVAIGKPERRELRQPAWLLVALVVLMTATLQGSRVQRAAGQDAGAKKAAEQIRSAAVDASIGNQANAAMVLQSA